MPGLSGLDVLQHIRARGDQVPVILITASDDPELERTATAAGAFCLLRKPFSTDALMDAVRSAHGDLAGVAPQ